MPHPRSGVPAVAMLALCVMLAAGAAEANRPHFLFAPLGEGGLLNLRMQARADRAVDVDKLIDSFADGPASTAPPLVPRLNTATGANHPSPVIIVPGIISTQLEAWETVSPYCFPFREKVWTPSLNTMKNPLCVNKWIQMMMLDPHTGLDPKGIRVRAIEGLTGADYFTTSIKSLGWLWNPLMAKLAEHGYDTDDITIAGYDWRLSWSNLELRDEYFSKLKVMIKTSVEHNGKKATLISHSMGATVFYYFLSWLTHADRDPAFVEKYIDKWINIGGTLLGAPKAAKTLATGELVEIGLASGLSARIQHPVYASWGSLQGLVPRGGPKLWRPSKGEEIAVNVDASATGFFSALRLLVTNPLNIFHDAIGHMPDEEDTKHFTWDQYSEFLGPARFTGPQYDRIREQLADHDYNYYERPPSETTPEMYDNPLATPLPNAPSLKIYNFYGTHQDTDVGLVFADMDAQTEDTPPDIKMDFGLSVQKGPAEDDEDYDVVSGVVKGNGDATVPLVSLAFMGTCAWKQTGPGTHNPAGSKVVNKEYKNYAGLLKATILRGNNDVSADHVDLLGNAVFLSDMMNLVVNDVDPEEYVSGDTMEHMASLATGLCPDEAASAPANGAGIPAPGGADEEDEEDEFHDAASTPEEVAELRRADRCAGIENPKRQEFAAGQGVANTVVDYDADPGLFCDSLRPFASKRPGMWAKRHCWCEALCGGTLACEADGRGGQRCTCGEMGLRQQQQHEEREAEEAPGAGLPEVAPAPEGPGMAPAPEVDLAERTPAARAFPARAAPAAAAVVQDGGDISPIFN